MKNKLKIFDVVLDIIIILLGALIIYWFVQLIFGGSPELSEFNFALIVVMGGVLFKIYREIGEFKIKTINSFENIGRDIGLIKNKLGIKE